MQQTQLGGSPRELALFAGAGGGILGGALLGWRTVCAVEVAEYPRRILLARQRDGFLPRFPIWDDIRTFDGHAWRGRVDIISGGFPCQDISPAGKRAGLAGECSGLWREFARIIAEVAPPQVLVENSSHLRGNGLVTVLQDLARLGYDAQWGVLGASAVGAPHQRKRMWIVANNNNRKRAFAIDGEVASACETTKTYGKDSSDTYGNPVQLQSGRPAGANREKALQPGRYDWWPMSVFQGMDDGLANRVDRIRATGNGQVSGVAALAYAKLS